jgi:hypothetical protein
LVLIYGVGRVLGYGPFFCNKLLGICFNALKKIGTCFNALKKYIEKRSKKTFEPTFGVGFCRAALVSEIYRNLFTVSQDFSFMSNL